MDASGQQPAGTPSPIPSPPEKRAPSESDERAYGMVCHLAGLGTIVGAIVVWLMVRERSPFADDQGKESINFQILISICAFAALILVTAAAGFAVLFPVTYLLWMALVAFDLVMVVLAAVEAGNGRKFRYPIAMRLLKQQ